MYILYCCLLLIFKYILPEAQIEEVEELSLTANQKRLEMSVFKWRIENERFGDYHYIKRSRGFVGNDFLVELQPMELRTFSLVFES